MKPTKRVKRGVVITEVIAGKYLIKKVVFVTPEGMEARLSFAGDHGSTIQLYFTTPPRKE